jgi:hypothetical protein
MFHEHHEGLWSVARRPHGQNKAQRTSIPHKARFSSSLIEDVNPEEKVDTYTYVTRYDGMLLNLQWQDSMVMVMSTVLL